MFLNILANLFEITFNMRTFISLINLFICMLTLTQAMKVIYLQEPKSITIQLGQIYEQIIPQFFEMYQAPSVTGFNISDPLQNEQPQCRISPIKPSQFIFNSVAYHYRLADPEKYFLGKKKIDNFSELAKLQGIIDSIEFKGKIITLFQNGYYSISSIDNKGNISSNEVKLLYDKTTNIHESNYGPQVFKTALNYGNLLKSQLHPEFMLFFGEDKALIMNSTAKVFEDMTGYQTLGLDFENAILTGKRVYAAMGEKGVFVYDVDFEKKALNLTHKINPKIIYNNTETTLQVSDLAFDPANNQLIVIDQQQGIHWVQVDKNQKNSTKESSILIERCSNIKIIPEEKVAVATCPQLLVVNLTDKSHKIIDEIEFDTECLLVNESRVMMFGQYRYAVYDLETDLVEKGESETKIDFVAVKDDWIVVINSISLSIGEIHPEQQKITCFANANSLQESVQARTNLSIEGICSQLYSMPMLCKTNESSIFYPSDSELSEIISHQKQVQNCAIVFELNVEIKNSRSVSYWQYVVAGGVMLWALCAGMVIYCVKDIKVKKDYETLREEVNTAREKVAENTDSQLFEK